MQPGWDPHSVALLWHVQGLSTMGYHRVHKREALV
jgi:hypothetical protein